VAVEVTPAPDAVAGESQASREVDTPVLDASSAPLPRGGPITRIAIPSIALDSEVVTAALVQRDGGLSWDVPAFRVGHAQGSAGAGEAGNAVLFGHVTSMRSGDVFKDLARVRVDDAIEVISDEQLMTYRVTEVASVERTDVSVIAATETPSITLITCTGVWLPTIWDYTERLVVRAELVT
jgi:sortase A